MSALGGARIFLTGGTGFLGSHLLPRLLEAGAEVSCLVRPKSAGRILPSRVRRVAGDCLGGYGLREGVEGRDIVIHMAGALFARGWGEYLENNARSCANLADALMAVNPNAKVVFVSSLACAGPCADPVGIAEDAPPAPVSAYGWSKFLCERALAAALGERLVIIRPPIIYGSGDRGLLPLFKSAGMGLAISPGAFRKFPVSVIHASDAADAIMLASGHNASGIYHLNDGRVHNMDDFCLAMARAQGRDKIFVARLPLPLMGASAALSSAVAAVFSRLAGFFGADPGAPRWNLDKYREARQCGWVANAGRIGLELGFEPKIDLDAGMAEAVRGYRQRGWL